MMRVWYFRGWWRWRIYASSIHSASSYSHDVLGCTRWSSSVRYYRDCCPLRRLLPACSYSPAGRSVLYSDWLSGLSIEYYWREWASFPLLYSSTGVSLPWSGWYRWIRWLSGLPTVVFSVFLHIWLRSCWCEFGVPVGLLSYLGMSDWCRYSSSSTFLPWG